MLRIALGVIVGLFAWMIVWFGMETVLSAIWPAFGVHQSAFQAAIENGGAFSADTTILLIHIVLGAIASALSGFIAALTAGENRRAPFVLGILLLALGFLKAGMSWPYVPMWYHLIFTAILLPMTILGSRLRTMAQ